jgi:hypothetical protein
MMKDDEVIRIGWDVQASKIPDANRASGVSASQVGSLRIPFDPLNPPTDPLQADHQAACAAADVERSAFVPGPR